MATRSTLNPTAVAADWYAKPFSAAPAAIPPHPPLVSGGWYHGSPAEPTGPGRYPIEQPRHKSVGLAFVLSVLFGPVGLVYVSANVGLVATALTAVVLLVAGMGFLPLLLIWPLAVAAAVWGAGHVVVSG
ncbi:hypothetical protein [Actinophytocola sp.]|uniref:hypothetical protein n=1 Tax=Actinophytocola sp. TaxID=1872138 RepID=UPI002EDA0EAF